MNYVAIACLALTLPAWAQIRTEKLHGRDVWTLETRDLRVSFTQSGGHFVRIALPEGGLVNPLWIQKQATVDTEQYLPARDEKAYGGGSSARLMAGLLGHNLCFPFWGDPTEQEYRAGMTFHGETGVVRWQRVPAGSGMLVIRADLPESRTAFSRSIRLAGRIAYFDSRGINLSGWDRPIGWCEHATIGPPFLERGVTRMDASVTRGRDSGDESGKEYRWPQGVADGQAIDLRTVRVVDKSGFVNNFLVDRAREFGFVAATHPGKRQVFGYVFRRTEFPWLNIWEANTPDMLTRGLEFSNTPTHGTMKKMFAAKPLFGATMFDWLDAKSTLRKRFIAFLSPAPEGFKGVSDVRIRGGKLEIVEAGGGSTIALDFDAGFFSRQ